jgi:DNA gyrase inhibitor GyrI
MPRNRGCRHFGAARCTASFTGKVQRRSTKRCVKLDDEHDDDMGFARGTIPGGRYARHRIYDWSGREPMIARWFEELEKDCVENGLELDHERPVSTSTGA